MPRKRRHPKKNPLKPGVSGARYRKEAAFKNSRRAATEFGQAAQCAVLIRRELMSMLEGMRQNEMHKKLTRIIGKLIREKRPAGTQRTRLNDLRWQQLEDLLFNPEAGLVTLLFEKSHVTIDRASGKITIVHPSFKVTDKVKSHRSITHMRIIAGAAAINFDRKTSSHDYSATDYLPFDLPPETSLRLSLELPAPVIHPLFIVIGFLSYKRVNTEYYEMPNRRYRALNIVCVQPAPPSAKKIKPPTAAKPKTKTVKKKKDR